MHILPITNENITKAISALRAGGVIAHATETCYGFACDLTNEKAVQKLFAIKRRPTDQPVSALFASIEEAKKWVEWNDLAEQLAKKHLPGPLTVVLPVKKEVELFPTPKKRQAASGKRLVLTLGARVSSHPVAQKLAELAGVPLSTTSANLHGKPETYSVAEIVNQFLGEALEPDLILDSGTLPQVAPSTIVDLTENSTKILRQGGTVI